MRLILNSLPVGSLKVGENTHRDLFDAQGRLLLAKDKQVTPAVIGLLIARQVYVIEYECNTNPAKTVVFSSQLYLSILSSIQQIYLNSNLLDMERIRESLILVDTIIHELEGNSKAYFEFNKFRTYDNYTYVHSLNVALISTIIARQIGYKGQSLRDLTLGALLHDLGKLRIPREILNKPDGLTPWEFDIVKRHPVDGQDMLKQVPVAIDILMTIRQHHERWLGQGYPDGLRKRGIHRNALIVGVADVFDALTADRPYRRGLPPYHVLEMIEAGTDTDFAPEIIKALKYSLVLYPENSIVTLNTGEIGIVIAIPQNHPTRPLVRILFDRNSNYVNEEKIVDLLQELTLFVKQVEFSNVS